MGLGAPWIGAEGLGSQEGGRGLYVAEKGICGGLRFVKGFRHLLRLTQQQAGRGHCYIVN